MSADHVLSSMPTRPLGRTGHQVGLFSLGGQGVIEQANSEATAIAVVRRALDLGVNYIDTAPRYTAGARESERNIGNALRGERQRVFLATKTHDRSRDGSLNALAPLPCRRPCTMSGRYR